jgi:fructosamine-3-kinase
VIAEAAARALGSRVRAARRVAGGDINDAWLVELDDGARVFVKTRADALPGEYATEAAALRWLGEVAGGLAVPEVLAIGGGSVGASKGGDEAAHRRVSTGGDEAARRHASTGGDEAAHRRVSTRGDAVSPRDASAGGDEAPPPSASRGGEPPFLALAWIDEGRLDAAGEEELGRGLAQVHAAGAPAFGAPPPGAPHRGLRLGAVELPAATGDDWPAFYAEHRIEPLLRAATDRGALPDRAPIERVIARLPELAGPPEPPARLHGDLWSGNVLAGRDGRPRLIDPAAYGGHREVDLAMLRLFGAIAPRTLAAYEEVAPLAAGHERRVALYQLFPLLVHAVLFGGGYGASAVRAARSAAP